MIPDIFGKNERYLTLLPVVLWVAYSFSHRSMLDYGLLSFGIFPIIDQVYWDVLDRQKKDGLIRSTSDIADFLLTNLFATMVAILSSVYYLGSLVVFFFVEKDYTVYSVGVAMAFGLVYWAFKVALYYKKFVNIAYFLCKAIRGNQCLIS